MALTCKYFCRPRVSNLRALVSKLLQLLLAAV